MFFLLQRGRPTWFSDPAAPRPWSQQAKLLAPKSPPAFKADPSVLESLAATSPAEGQLQLQLTRPDSSPGGGLDWRVVEADEQLHADLGIGQASVQIAYLATGWAKPTNRATLRNPSYFSVPGKFFLPDLTPFTAEDYRRLKVRKWDCTLHFREGRPTLAFMLRFTDLEGWKLLGLHAFDARTHAPVHGGGYSHGPRELGYHIETDLALWHETPVDLVLDLALGPPKVFEFPARTNVWQEYPGGAVALVAKINGDERSWSSSFNGKTETITVSFETKPEKPQCSLIFYCQPAAHPAPIDFELLDQEGEVIPGAGGGSSGRLAIKSVRTAVTNVAKVRLKFYPNHRRVVFHLPRLPGLPESNRHVENLLDVRVPFAHFRAQYQMRSWLESMLQVQLRQSTSPTVPPGTFPVEFTDATVGEALKFYLGLFPPGTQARLDPEACTLRLAPSSIYTLLRRIAEWFQRGFR